MNTLKKIITEKSSTLINLKKKNSIEMLKEKISHYNNFIDFKKKLKNESNKISVIAEIKKSSPSAGVIIEDYDPKIIAKNYLDGGASCLSILTEEKFFLGKLEHITEVKNVIKLPILCKDFFIDPFQIYLSRAAGADAILIILSAIDYSLAVELYELANKLNLTTIIEVHTEEEAKKALNFKEAIIGINNRNLTTLKTDISTTYRLYEILNNHSQPLISESGIKTKKEIHEIVKKTKINNFLIGESLLTSKNISSSLREFTQISL